MRQSIGIVPTQEQLDQLLDLLTPYIEREAQGLHVNYVWTMPKQIPLKDFACDGLSNAHAVMKLKRALAARWRSDPDGRSDLATWIVASWGGVRRNDPATLQSYVRRTEEDLATGGLKGVASWSKILTIRDPEQFAIFDARVSASLNAIQLMSDRVQLLFPNLPTRNTKLPEFQRSLRKRIQRRPYYQIASTQIYPTYMRLMNGVAQRLGHSSPDTAEMVLFANFEALAIQSQINA